MPLLQALAHPQALAQALAPLLAQALARPQAAAPGLAPPQALRLLQVLAQSLVHLPVPQVAQEALLPLQAQSLVLPLVPQVAQEALPQSQEPLQVHTLLRPC